MNTDIIPCPIVSRQGFFSPFEVGGENLTIFAGPCSLENPDIGMEVALRLKTLCGTLGFNYVFKASFDKANRTSIKSWRGPGLEKGLDEMRKIREELGVPLLTDIHEPWQADPAGDVADVLQIPAFLCRQTDLLVAAARTSCPLHIKKAQFLAPRDMESVLKKCRDSGNSRLMLCERGTSFGYHQLIVDMTSLVEMRSLGFPVVFDATHSVQKPSAQGDKSGGERRYALPLARAAAAVGVDGIFLETHPNPEDALCDGPNMVPLDRVESFLLQVKAIDSAVRGGIGFSSSQVWD
jgi:2-dehydro-3-deoxyphosphooctonate aldolase (KDO 8-P synthase)